MKILVFSPYYPPHTGGLETHSDEFNKYLSQRGIDITVFTPRLPSDTPEREVRYRNVTIIRYPAFEIISNYPLPKFWLPYFWKLLIPFFDEKYDAVLSRTRFFFSSFLALIYSKIKRTRWIHIEHGSDFVKLSSTFSTFLAKIYDFSFGRIIFLFSDLNVSISKAVQNFIFLFDKRESPIIYRGLDFDILNTVKPDSQLKEKYNGKIIICTVARLYKWKGIENTIEAIKLLPPEIKERVVFFIVGDGEDYDYLKKISSDEPSIVMLGNLPRENAIAILKIATLYIHSAYPGGGLSTSLLEAMYCGCAVIATPNEGANEVVVDNVNGLLIDKSDRKEISEKIQGILSHEQIDLLREKAISTIKNNFSWDNSIKKYVQILSQKN